MKTLKIKEGSSIWQIATMWGTERLDTNLCTLFWESLWNLAVLSFFISIFTVFSAFFLASLSASISTGIMIWSVPVVIVTVALILILVALILIFIVFLYSLLYSKITENPGRIIQTTATIYSSYKDKYCPLVEEVKK